MQKREPAHTADEPGEALRWQRKALQDIRRLEENPDELADYRDEARQWAEDGGHAEA